MNGQRREQRHLAFPLRFIRPWILVLFSAAIVGAWTQFPALDLRTPAHCYLDNGGVESRVAVQIKLQHRFSLFPS